MNQKKRSRRERAIVVQERLVETHTQALASEKDDKEQKKLKKKIERAQITIENTKRNLR
tara:strand:- start:405 stop:581 length:177 start_codon:yes stop_codon:yes gene_type:complete